MGDTSVAVGISSIDIAELGSFVSQAVGLPCWRAYTSAGNSPALLLGRRIERSIADAMKSHPRWKSLPPDSDRFFTAEVYLIIWCSWRLDGDLEPRSSSDDAEDSAHAAIGELVGTSLQSAKVSMPAGDLELLFSNGQCLRAFCDHVPGNPSFDGNWELRVQRSHAMVGPGAICRYTDDVDM
jgi:hypothetical protein